MFGWQGTEHMIGMWMWWIVAAVAIVIGVWFMRSSGRDQRPRADTSAETLLKQRYARGELDEETYERMLAELRR